MALVISRVIGVVAVALALLVVPVANNADPVLAVFIAYTAVLAGAVASLGMRSARLAFVTIALSAIGLLVLTHTSSEGWRPPSIASVSAWLAYVAIPVVPAIIVIGFGAYLRRPKARNRAAHS